MPHRFDPTVLREYGIRGVVGTTLFAADARTLGRVFAQRLVAEGGRYAAPNAASSRTARYSSTARPADPDGRPADPSTRVRSPASAWIKLASTAKPSRRPTPRRCSAAARSRTAGAAGRCRESGHAGSSRTSNDTSPSRPNAQNQRYARLRCTSSHSRRSERRPPSSYFSPRAPSCVSAVCGSVFIQGGDPRVCVPRVWHDCVLAQITAELVIAQA
jgi:hypothetical protein